MDSFFPEIDLPQQFLTKIRKYGKQKTFKPKEIIIHQGEWFNDLYFIEEGFVKYTLFSIEGGVQTICYLGKGFFLGEYAYTSGGDNSTVTLEAATTLKLLLFNQNDKTNLYRIADFKRFLLRNMALMTRLVKTQIESLSLYTSEQRIAKTIEDSKKHFTYFGKKEAGKYYLTKKEIADLSGCSLETVNRYAKIHSQKE
ncbi:MAG TPA: Crp/Fnr family transcriptional regulator [Peptococcaceae bacterium]|nr:Crp/Fnr family transcriptional regulator [Peptococcaceae bacterium]